MKIAPKLIDGFIKKPAPAALAILLYGPDEGLVRERLDALTRNIVSDIRDPFNVAELSGGQLSGTPARLMDEVLSISMLGGRRVVRVTGATDEMTPLVKNALNALRPGDSLLLLGAGELSPRSSLRALFENAENGAAIPCYVEDERDIGRVIGDSLRAAGSTIPPEAIAYMANNVVGDRAVARSEVEKLITYMGGGKKTISLDDVIACVGNSAALSLDDLAKHVASGQFAAAERILGHVLAEGIPPVSVLRNLQNYFLRLHLAKSRVQQGESTEEAVKKLRPALFFKIRPAFEFQMTVWSLPQMEQAVMLLAGAEAKCKQTANDPHTLCSRAVLSLSQLGAKAAGARRRA